MIYRLYKIAGRIGTGMEKMEISFEKMPDAIAENETSLAAFDPEANTIYIYNDHILDVSSIVQKFKNQCDLPNKHQFNIIRK